MSNIDEKGIGKGRRVPRGWADYPNLRFRPHAPAAARGRLQQAIARCLRVHGPDVSASTIYDWCETWPDGRRYRYEMCERTGRASTIGHPWIWRLRNSELPADATQTVDNAENNSDAE
jgi:hypothetical protein